MKTSIIVPYKNAGPWIGRCVESLKAQKGNFVFLFINDGSTDDGEAIAKEAAGSDPRFLWFDNERRPGVSGARNTGITHATGDYVAFLDADDELHPDAWKTAENGQNGPYSIVQYNHIRQYRNGRTAIKHKNPDGMHGIDDMPPLWEWVTNKVFRREFIRGIWFEERLQYGEDELFMLECLAVEPKIRCVDGVMMVHHFDNTESLSKQKREVDLWRQIGEIERFLIRQGDPALRCFVCDWLSVHWRSESFKRLIGHAT